MPNDLRVHHVGVIVDEMTDAVAFLSNILGLKVSDVLDVGPGLVAWAEAGDIHIELIQYSDPKLQARLGDAPAKIEHIAFHTDDADATYAELASKGVEFAGPPKAWNDRKSFFTTPESCDGVMYQFRQPIEWTPRED